MRRWVAVGWNKNRHVQAFFAELKRRGVLKAATAYLVVSWLVLEVGHTLFLIFELPHLGMQIVFVLLALGFPIAVGAAWHYRFAASDHAEQHAHEEAHGGSQLAIVFAAVAVMVIGTVIVMRFMGYEGHGSSHDEHASSTAQTHAPSGADDAAATPASATAFAPPEHSLAVMPFVNMSGDDKDEYFSDGLSEELLNSLVRVNGLQVAARTSSFSFKGKASDIPTIGRQLNVAAVLEGSVRKAGQQVRITAQLVNAVNGYHLWSATFDRELKNILALQTEIATAVTEALKVRLLPDDSSRIVAGGSNNPEAYDFYLRGTALHHQRLNEASDRAALAAFDEAVRLDPDFALAHAAYAEAMSLIALDWTEDPKEFQRLTALANTHADRAVQLAPTLGAGYIAQARIILNSSLELSKAEAATRRAVELEPGNALALVEFADVVSRQARFDQALDAATRAVKLDPLSAATWRMQAVSLYNGRQHVQAAVAFKKALALQPENRSVRSWMSLNELMLGHIDEAISLCEPDESWYGRHCLVMAYHKKGRLDEAAAVLRGLKKEFGDDLAYQYSQVYAQWGEPQQALEWLIAAVRLEDPGLWDLQVDPLLDPIRDTPQFKEVMQRLYPK